MILVLTLLVMQRGTNDTVTDFPVLIPCKANAQQGLATFLGANPAEGFQPVRAFTDADLNRDRLAKTMAVAELKVVTALLALSQALEKKDRLAIRQARNDLLTALGRKGRFEPDPATLKDLSLIDGIKPDEVQLAALELCFARIGEEDEKCMLSWRLSEALDSVRLVLWWSGKRFRPALYCPDLKSALYTYVLTRVSARRGLGVCPFCGVLFLKKRADQNYCSVAHREAHRVARWRAANAAKSKRVKGRKNGTRKTR